MNKNTLVLIAIVVAVVIGVVALGGYLKSISPTPVQPNPNIIGEKVFYRDYSYMTGSKDAEVTLVEFADFQCPFCAEANPIVTQVMDKYKSNPNFNFVFRHFPLSQHSNAQISAEAAEAAGSQGKFWEMEKLIYEHQNDWAGSINPVGVLVDLAAQLNLDTSKFKDEITSSKYINEITQDEKDGEALGVNSTPTFFINGEKVASYQTLDNRISELLK